tara:strand:- start:123 stop:260 length:138 start_codon:yes stop_codon:yes gene_type:complete
MLGTRPPPSLPLEKGEGQKKGASLKKGEGQKKGASLKKVGRDRTK